MRDLIEKLEKLTGPDREIDYAILSLMDPSYFKWCVDKGKELNKRARDNGLPDRAEACRLDGFSGCLRYTASIDAALPTERIVSVVTIDLKRWTAVCLCADGHTQVSGEGNTEALARRIAALKAREATQSKGK